MFSHLTSALDDASPHQGRKIVAIYLLLFAFNVAVWTWAFAALSTHPTLLGTALLAYVLGLRHAVDADHIAAIDNVVISQAGWPWRMRRGQVPTRIDKAAVSSARPSFEAQQHSRRSLLRRIASVVPSTASTAVTAPCRTTTV